MRFLLRDKRGQTLAEFALLVPVLFLLVMGIFQMGYIGLTYVVVNHAAFQVARVACVNEDDAEEAARRAIPFTRGAVGVDIVSPGGGDDLEVTVTYEMPLYFPLINALFRRLYNLPDYLLPVRATCLIKREPV